MPDIQPVIDPACLIEALRNVGWRRTPGIEDGEAVLIPGGAAVIIPLDPMAPGYPEKMALALEQLRDHGIRESLLEGTPGPAPGNGALP